MSGTPKRGMDFASWNTDIFENDTKIDELIDAQGWIGFSIYFYLCQKAYASEGYFYRWSYANAATTARRMGGGIGSETVKQTVAACLQIGLFDKRLFDLGSVLTSKGIQRRFVEVAKKRNYRTVDGTIWLLDQNESKGLVICAENSHSRDGNSYSLSENGDKSKVKESKVKYIKEKSIEKKSAFTPPSREDVIAYAKSRNSNVDPDRFFDYFNEGKWIDSKGNPVRNWKQKFITWEKNAEPAANKPKAKTAGTYKGRDFFDDDD